MKVYDDKTVAHIFMGQFLACHVLCNNLIRREQMQNAEATIFILFHLLLLQMRSILLYLDVKRLKILFLKIF